MVAIFIGSSTEGSDIAYALQAEIKSRHDDWKLNHWKQGVFGVSQFALQSLIEATHKYDFAVLIVTPDDVVEKRGHAQFAPRDNVLFELGLFSGALGLDRTFIIADQIKGPLSLPSDLSGLTWLPFTSKPDTDHRTELSVAIFELILKVKKLRPRGDSRDGHPPVQSPRTGRGGGPGDHRSTREVLMAEVLQIATDAEAQGWVVKSFSDTAVRLIKPSGKKHSFSLTGDADMLRARLRLFANELRADGLRIGRNARTPLGR